MERARIDVHRRRVQPGVGWPLDVGRHQREIPAIRLAFLAGNTRLAAERHQTTQTHAIDVVEITLVIDSGSYHKTIHHARIVGRVVGGDTRCHRQRAVAARLAENLDFADIRCLPGGDSGSGHHIHVLTGDGGRRRVIIRIDIPLLLEGGATEIESLPATARARLRNRPRLGLRFRIDPLIDAGVVGPVGVDHHPLCGKVAKHRETLPCQSPQGS